MFTLKQIFKIVNLILSWFFSPFLSFVISQVFSLENRNFSRPQGKYFSYRTNQNFPVIFTLFLSIWKFTNFFTIPGHCVKLTNLDFEKLPLSYHVIWTWWLFKFLEYFHIITDFFCTILANLKGWTFEKLTFGCWPASARPPLGKLIHLAIFGRENSTWTSDFRRYFCLLNWVLLWTSRSAETEDTISWRK